MARFRAVGDRRLNPIAAPRKFLGKAGFDEPFVEAFECGVQGQDEERDVAVDQPDDDGRPITVEPVARTPEVQPTEEGVEVLTILK